MKKRLITDFFQPGGSSEKKLRLDDQDDEVDDLNVGVEDLDGGSGIDNQTDHEDLDMLNDLGGHG